MAGFSDLPHEIVAMILQEVIPTLLPKRAMLASHMRLNRTFYACLKASLYANPLDHIMERPEQFVKFQKVVSLDPTLLSSVTTYILPFAGNHEGNRDPHHIKLHDWFTRVLACKKLDLAIEDGFWPPTAEQAARLSQITKLTLTSWILGSDYFEPGRKLSRTILEAWYKHMPKLTTLYIRHMDAPGITNLTHLPSTLVRLELLGSRVLTYLSSENLGLILRGLPLLQHFLLAEINVPVQEVAAVLDASLSPRVTSFGIGFDELDDTPSGVYHIDEEPMWERELAFLLQKRYTSLTFYLLIYVVDFVETLAASETAKTVKRVAIKILKTRDYPIGELSQTRESAFQSMFKLLDRSILPNLQLIAGSRIKEQLRQLRGWAAFVIQAGEVGVTFVDPED